METAGSSATSVKIYHPARRLILENSRKYMSGKTCFSGVESSSIFQISFLFLIQLLALMTFMAHTIPQLQPNERRTTESWSMQIDVFWDMPPSSMSEELFLYSKKESITSVKRWHGFTRLRDVTSYKIYSLIFIITVVKTVQYVTSCVPLYLLKHSSCRKIQRIESVFVLNSTSA
jgi:hypothetical protein